MHANVRRRRQAYGEYLRRKTGQQVADDQALGESSNEVALRDAQW
ncbi:MAG TPA: hypothetical protein VFX60_01255 [Micromonospora sp.]|nr:hypothetical protein [Micromonospora sp.]